MSSSECLFCREPGGELAWQDDLCRVVWPREPQYPGLCRVITNTHAKEMTDLNAAERQHLMTVVFGVEDALRTLLAPDKINLASLGNVVAHVHWHVIPRHRDDAHFPGSIWSAAQREHNPTLPADFIERLKSLLAARLRHF